MWYTSSRFSVRIVPEKGDPGKCLVTAHALQCLLRFAGAVAVDVYRVKDGRYKPKFRLVMPKDEAEKLVINAFRESNGDSGPDPYAGFGLDNPDLRQIAFGDDDLEP